MLTLRLINLSGFGEGGDEDVKKAQNTDIIVRKLGLSLHKWLRPAAQDLEVLEVFFLFLNNRTNMNQMLHLHIKYLPADWQRADDGA